MITKKSESKKQMFSNAQDVEGTPLLIYPVKKDLNWLKVVIYALVGLIIVATVVRFL